MLKKLIKYDIRSLSNTLLPIYGITLLISLTSVIFQKISDVTPIFKMPMGLITALAILLSVGLTIITFIVGIQKYYNQIIKDEGYLIHTLPVKKHNIILSKITSQLIFQILSCIITAISITIITQIPLKDIISASEEIIKSLTDYSSITFMLGMLLALISYITSTLLIYVSISFGQKHSNNKIKFSVGYGIIIYIITLTLTGLIYTPLLADNKFIEELNKKMPAESVLNIALLIIIGIMVLTSAVYFYLTTKNLEKKLNLE